MAAVRLSTGKLARFCARRWWLIIPLWIIIAMLSALVASKYLSSALTSELKFTRPNESQQGMQLLKDRLRGPEQITEIVIVSSDSSTVDDPAFRQQVDQLAKDLIGLGPDVISGGTYYYQANDPSLVSQDRHTTLIPLVMAGTISDAEKNVDQVRAVTAAAAQRSGFKVITTGGASSNNDFNKLAESDLRRAELIGIPIAMVILMAVFFMTFFYPLLKVIFRSNREKEAGGAGKKVSGMVIGLLIVLGPILAAVLPMALAGVSIINAVGLTALFGQRFVLSFFVVNMITMMGLAVGIDYSLFVVSRYREELLSGKPNLAAIEKAGGTASRAVLFSGMTVILALLGMLIVPMSLFYSLAVGAMFVVAMSVLAALTLLPAILGISGNRIKIPKVSAEDQVSAVSGGFWAWASREVMKRPLLNAILATAILLIPASFYFQIHTGANGIKALPDSYESKRGFLILDSQFSYGLVSPAEVVIDGDLNSQPVKDAISRLEQEVSSDDAFFRDPRSGQVAVKVEVNQGGDLGVVSLPVAGSPESDTATGAVRSLRQTHIPAAFAGTGASTYVTGAPALNLDYFTMTDTYRPIVFLFVLGLSFMLLMVVFHSLVVPLKAIIMNLLSVGAAYGLIVIVFEKGVGASLLHFQQVESVEAWVPLFLFSVLFGLSMDYHVFLLGRIRECYQQTHDNSRSVAFGLRSTGSIITGAALIMVVVFAGFASGQLVMFQQMGFGLAVAVLLDATIVRSILVPSTMKLLGDWNWYLPRWLRWLPDFHVEGGRAEELRLEEDEGQCGTD